MGLPTFFRGKVVAGFGRGGKQLGCPTANIEESVVASIDVVCGVFYGLARVNNGEVHDVVLSVGWNPHFKNEKKTVEVHFLHQFNEDFYGSIVECLICGFIREMTSFNGLQELMDAIANDIRIAKEQLKSIDRESIIDRYFKGVEKASI